MFYYKIVLLIYFSYSLLSAQNNQEKDTVYVLEPVVISARSENSILNIPYSINVVDKAEIEENRGLSLKESLSQIPGIIINNRNNPSMGDRITIRGIGSRASFGVRGIKILYDGIPLTLPDGQSQLNNIDFSSLGSIEVLRGPASNLYGNASGGVINIKSENPSEKIIEINPAFTVGSFGLNNYNLKTSGTIDDFSYLLSFNKFLYNGFRQHSSAESFHVNSNINYKFSEKITLKSIINYFDSPYLLNPSSLSKSDAINSPAFARDFIKNQGAGEKASQGEYGLTANIFFDESFSNTTTAYFIHRSLINPIPGRIIDLNRSAGGFRTFFGKEINSEIFDIDINAGFDVEFQNDVRNEYVNNGIVRKNINAKDMFDKLQYGSLQITQEEKVIGAAPFVSVDFLYNKNWGIHAGLRYDNYTFKVNDLLLTDGDDSGERSINNISPMGGIIFHPSSFIKIYANYATSFQTPTTTELSNSPDGSGGFNSSLNPEIIKSYEAGVWGILSDLNINFESAFFIMNFEDMLIPYQSQAAGSEEIFFRNAGKAENIGAEFKMSWFPSKNIFFNVSYTSMNFTFKDYLVEINNNGNLDYAQLSGNKVPGVSPNNISSEISYAFPFNLSLKFKVEWYDKYFANDFNGPAPEENSTIENFINNDYLNVDVIIRYTLSMKYFDVNIYTGIINIFDNRYNGSIVPNAAGNRFFEPSPGSNWYLKIDVSL